MIEIREMSNDEAETLLEQVKYGHLGCAVNDEPYVVPVHYSYHRPDIYIYTTDGRKSEIISVNPRVCLQVERVQDDGHWQSVLVTGDASRLEDPADKDAALKIILDDNPKLAPAVSLKWSNNWIRENVEVIYRITPSKITGRQADQIETHAATFQGASVRRPLS
jgi:nitroimidazol reductase NimA-like FMN-containing flavoprotein (pyridoxamine 5'-phosphate oxidase superfamily)